jgi:hypothetical protein
MWIGGIHPEEKFVPPMLPSLVFEALAGDDWLHAIPLVCTD